MREKWRGWEEGKQRERKAEREGRDSRNEKKELYWNKEKKRLVKEIEEK